MTRGIAEVLYNASGEVWFDDPEVWESTRGLYINTTASFGLRWNNGKCDGCGNPSDGNGPIRQFAIFVKDGTPGVSDVIIDGASRFKRVSAGGTFGGSISVTGARNFECVDNYVIDADASSPTKFLYAASDSVVRITGNFFQSNSLTTGYTNSRMIDLSLPSSIDTVVDGNTFQNANNNTFENFIASEAPLLGGTVKNNAFIGNVSAAMNPNINNASARNNTDASSYGLVEHWGSNPPASGTWSVGDVIRNTKPTANGVFAWVCIAAGAPGTWAPVPIGK